MRPTLIDVHIYGFGCIVDDEYWPEVRDGQCVWVCMRFNYDSDDFWDFVVMDASRLRYRRALAYNVVENCKLRCDHHFYNVPENWLPVVDAALVAFADEL